ncbi:MAG: FkbM family methyltransferase [Vicinamibacterales bacterium]
MNLDRPISPLLAGLTGVPWGLKKRIASRPLAWRYYTALCRRAGWGAAHLGWQTPRNGPFAGIRTQALHPNHLWVLVGAYEVGVTACLIAILGELAQRGPSVEVWDIGANHGRMTLLCARHGASRVLAVEPSTANIDVLRQHLAANPSLAERIDVLNVAISDHDGDVELLVNQSDGAVCQIRASGVRAYDSDPATTIATIASHRLDSLAQSRGSAPALVKIDVEGAEALVLEGASRLLATSRPIFIVEVHNVEAGRACLDLFEAARYSCERISAGGKLLPINIDVSHGHLLARPRA